MSMYYDDEKYYDDYEEENLDDESEEVTLDEFVKKLNGRYDF